MLTRWHQRRSKPIRVAHLGRLVGALALVAGLSGLNAAVSEAAPERAGGLIAYLDQAEVSLLAVAGPSGRIDAFNTVAADNDNEEEEEAEEEGQEDGLLPGGQAEQRAQGLYDKAEARDEDHDN